MKIARRYFAIVAVATLFGAPTVQGAALEHLLYTFTAGHAVDLGFGSSSFPGIGGATPYVLDGDTVKPLTYGAPIPWWTVQGAQSLATDTSRNVYVSTASNVLKFPPSSGLVINGTIFDTLPIGTGQLAITPSDRIYVAVNCTVTAFDQAPILHQVAQWGSCGSAPGEFSPIDTLMEIAVAPDGDVLVSDQGNHRVQRFTASGTYVSEFGSAGTGPGQFNVSPGQPGMPIAVDPAGSIYVMDLTRIQKFNSSGGYVGFWNMIGSARSALAYDETNDTLVAVNTTDAYRTASNVPPADHGVIHVVGAPPGVSLRSDESLDAAAGVALHMVLHLPNGVIQNVERDADLDGVYEGVGASISPDSQTARFEMTFARPGVQRFGLRLTAVGREYTWTETLDLLEPKVGVTINSGAEYTNNPNVTVTLICPIGATRALLSNDGGFDQAKAIAAGSPSATARVNVAWRIPSGAERIPKTVYARYTGQPGGQVTLSDDIILDQTAPSVVSASLAPISTTQSIRAKRAFKVRIKARDRLSGVNLVQIATRKRSPGRWLPFRKAVNITATTAPRWVRVRDRAGNRSAWKAIR